MLKNQMQNLLVIWLFLCVFALNAKAQKNDPRRRGSLNAANPARKIITGKVTNVTGLPQEGADVILTGPVEV